MTSQVSSTNQMIAALAGGSLPFILRMVMEPEKPDIEIGTVSFKSQLDEVIKNFVQVWPIYDLPFELYTEEDARKDREKAEEKRRREEEERTGRACGTGDAVESRASSADDLTVPVAAAAAITTTALLTTQFSTMDTVDGRWAGAAASLPARRKSPVPPPLTLKTADGDGPSAADDEVKKPLLDDKLADQVSPSRRVEFDDTAAADTRTPEPEVDIVIYLPLKGADDANWLDLEWLEKEQVDETVMDRDNDDDDTDDWERCRQSTINSGLLETVNEETYGDHPVFFDNDDNDDDEDVKMRPMKNEYPMKELGKRGVDGDDDERRRRTRYAAHTPPPVRNPPPTYGTAVGADMETSSTDQKRGNGAIPGRNTVVPIVHR